MASVRAVDHAPRQVEREFRQLLADGARLRPAGGARSDPSSLLRDGYVPRHRIDLFDTRFYLARVRQNPDIRFFVAYVVQGDVFPRIFYKDLSLIWRSASHWMRTDGETWIGKGDLRTLMEDGKKYEYTAESTTDLPLELQAALETAARASRRIPHDERAVAKVLRRAPSGRIEPFSDWSAPRERAAADPRNRIHGGRSVAWFSRPGDPASLEFARGYEPNFRRGVIEQTRSSSSLYGGRLRRFRILSTNRRIQYLFMAGPRQVWIIPPQATTIELTSYGVRSVDVVSDDDLAIPGFEYHFMDRTCDPPELVSQIPLGYVGERSEFDVTRADASPWLDRLPVIQEFRRIVLRSGRS